MDKKTETTKVKMTNPFDVDILTWGGEVIKPGETKMVDVPVVKTETFNLNQKKVRMNYGMKLKIF